MPSVFYTFSDASKLSHGELSAAGFRAAYQRRLLRVAARTAGGIALFLRDDIEAYLARRDARLDARREAREARTS